ncbi:hypothetical protein BJI67_07075 [Acidihalobacter aeolianus]|uniref:Uncharacterized protein n=1 Tax=Acidihalobacter aeolianus TaxID=2792603 RepID=A0A1D8K7B3_9GAMM|nr:hypothetical protein BJI67_07075 [Acidihalobacter aeolianus]
MNLDRCGIERDVIDLDIDHIIFLQGQEDSIQHALFGPAIGAHIDAVPATETGWQTAPLATVLCDIQDRIKYL